MLSSNMGVQCILACLMRSLLTVSGKKPDCSLGERWIMEELIKDSLFIGLLSKGFALDFEANADIGGGYECFMFTNSTHVAVITGENVPSKTRGGRDRMAYRYYCFRFGDDRALHQFLVAEGINGNQNLFNGEYGPMFMRLINKLKSYGTRNAEILIRPLTKAPSRQGHGCADQYSEKSKLVYLSK